MTWTTEFALSDRERYLAAGDVAVYCQHLPQNPMLSGGNMLGTAQQRAGVRLRGNAEQPRRRNIIEVRRECAASTRVLNVRRMLMFGPATILRGAGVDCFRIACPLSGSRGEDKRKQADRTELYLEILPAHRYSRCQRLRRVLKFILADGLLSGELRSVRERPEVAHLRGRGSAATCTSFG